VNGDQSRIISGPTYSVPVYTGNVGAYPIIPTNLRLPNPADYTITYQNGTLYVDPKGNGAKNIKPVLDCVEQLLPNDPSGFSYRAHFHYENPNSTTLFIPIGPNNKITTSGPYSGNPPEIFYPGTGPYLVYFNGQKLNWTVISYNGNQSTSQASEASSTSNKCSSGGGTLRVDGNNIAQPAPSLATAPVSTGPVTNLVNAYPNPVI
jgi:hypothetical protein